MRLEHLLSGAKNNRQVIDPQGENTRILELVSRIRQGVDIRNWSLTTLVMIDTLYLALVPDSLVAQLVRAPH